MGLWRWRHNALCRTTDLAEAWVAFAALVLICLVAPAAGWLFGAATLASLQETARLQQAHRHPVTAEVLGPARGSDIGPRDPGASADHRIRTPVRAGWTAPDGTLRTGTVTVARQSAQPGDTVRIWTDGRGRPVNPPMNAATAREHAVLAGAGVAVASAALVEGVRRSVVRQLTQRRYARLDREWARTGPDWGRTGAGS
jgi:F0F1-type ATP synthase membrane subunit c/vacuolar-type H+-ATPase subunit K